MQSSRFFGAKWLMRVWSVSIYNAVRAHFEFMNKLGVDRWCFHDRDIAPDGKTLKVFTSSFNGWHWMT